MKIIKSIIDKCGVRGDATLCIVIFVLKSILMADCFDCFSRLIFLCSSVQELSDMFTSTFMDIEIWILDFYHIFV